MVNSSGWGREVKINLGGEGMGNAVSGCNVVKETEFACIENQLNNLRELVLVVRDKAWAINNQQTPKCEEAKSPQPNDAASALRESIRVITSIVVDARDSLQTFI